MTDLIAHEPVHEVHAAHAAHAAHGPPDHMVPLIQFDHLYESVLGDTSTHEFYKEIVPLLYVFFMPILSLLLALLCTGTMSGVNAVPWPPPKERFLEHPKEARAKRSAGHRVIRRIVTGVQAIGGMQKDAATTRSKGSKPDPGGV